ncbi:O-Antigen ligase [Novipirellula galeiformis]|uniref:O-Antigen ligase n=1 Tax=Novipirellula galeiformis TaxID=2528004 RepID=A0A5C6CUU7_9BACT|nr:O-antigen ligase family protein [Novipirellula galeiformis]TWU27191.1 O-Antigen ligase [Novipirellula galeiformis]
MKTIALLLRQLSLWASACILTALPCVVAFDYGGIHPWAQWASGVAVLVAGVLALPSIMDREIQGGPRFHWLAIVLLGWAAFAWFQTLPLPGSLVSILSPGSAAAYTTWLDPILGPQSDGTAGRSSMHPISIDPASSRHTLAMLLVVATLAWTSATVFQNRKRLVLLLAGLAAGAAVHAGLGIFLLISPESDLLGMNSIDLGIHFAAFINRNNAALMMNIGVGASLGALAWRLSALIGTEVDDENFEVNDLISLASDRDSSVAVISLVLCTAALLVCGSRGGLVSAVIGLTLALGWIRARRGTTTIPVIIAIISIAVAMLIVPFNLDLTSLNRMELFSDQDESTLLNDGRIPLWSDSIAAAITYLPTGSGLGTFADAHLTQLAQSSDGWAHHADNLWLEMFTEQGIPGVIFISVLLVGMILSLNKLDDSPDPVDHGLRVAGWYILGSLAVSQFFDMGLIIPANLIACAIILSVIATRGIMVLPSTPDARVRGNELQTPDSVGNEGNENDESENAENEELPSAALPIARKPRIRFQAQKSPLPPIAVACIVFLPSLWAYRVLQSDAHIDSLTQTAQGMLNQSGPEPEQLESVLAPLESLAKQTASPIVFRILSDIHFQLARYDEVLQGSPQTTAQLRSLYLQTAPAVRRLKWHRSNASLATKPSSSGVSHAVGVEHEEAEKEIVSPQPLSPHYAASLQHAESELRVRPLSREARTASLYLDFVYTDPTRTRAILNQLCTLYGTNSTALRQLAQLSLDSYELELGVTYLKQLLERQPSQTAAALKMLEAYPELSLSSVVPPSPVNYRAAAKYLNTRPAPDLVFLSQALDGLGCDQSETISERASCEELWADTAYVLKRYQESFAGYERAIRLDAKNVALRLKLITRLGAQHQRAKALSEARNAKRLFPDEERFDGLIEQMANRP